jgi:hypothetical protein
MAKVAIEGRKVRVGSVALPLLSGEVHYWRMAPECWRPVLERVKEMGLAILATYICWDFHELAPGAYDFEGRTDPRRNLAAFLDLVEEMGLWIIIRPGPYTYAEWRNAGVPDYAAPFHRLEPVYLQYARRYLEAAVTAFRSHQATAGGRIILCQAENELDCWPHMHTESLGLGSRAGLFQSFLVERYGSVDALNRAWNAGFAEVEEARAVLSLPSGRQEWLPRYLDFYRFKHWFVLKAARWTVDTLRELGVDVPIFMNVIPTHANEPWAAMEGVADLVGVDLYPSNTFRRDDEHRKFLEAVRYTRTYSRLPWCPEFEAGIWHGGHLESEMGALLPNHYRMAAVSALLGGLAGWNWYMLANRDNWYMSPINEWGRTRVELFKVFQQITRLFLEIDPPTLEKLSNIGATIDALQQAAAHPESEVLRSLYTAGLDYEFFDLSTGRVEKPFLFYSGEEWLSQEGQQRLVDTIKAGGQLICIGRAPRFDEFMRPLNLLGVPEPAGVLGDIGELYLSIDLPNAPLQVKSRWLEHFSATPGSPIQARRGSVDPEAVEEMQLLCALPEGDQYITGYTQRIGKGALTYLGLQPSAELATGLLAALGAAIPVRSLTQDISTALFRREDTFYLAAVNTGRESKAFETRLSPDLFSGKRLKIRNLFDKRVMNALLDRDQLLALPLPALDGTIFELIVHE